MTVEHPICYQSYLFRLWRDDPDSPLRAVLREPAERRSLWLFLIKSFV